MIVKRSFIPTIIKELVKFDCVNDVKYAQMQGEGIGKWYGLINDAIIQDGVDAPSHVCAFESAYEKISKIKNPHLQLSKISLPD